jgi:hypothetical protein
MTRWGPVHACDRCGEEVQYHLPTPPNLPRLYQAGSLERHQCRSFRVPDERVMIECFCGVDVDLVGERRYERATTIPHSCEMIPQVSSQPLPPPLPRRSLPPGVIVLR